MAEIIKTTFQFRRGNADVWERNNPILQRGEPGFVLDENQLKVGDGVTPWNELPYIGGGDWNMSPDGNSLVISSNGELMLYGFEEAAESQIPIKGADGKLHWITVNLSAVTGYMDDLKQRETVVFYGGSASEVLS
jgi:hypothetical protein